MESTGDWENGLCSHVCGGDCGTCMGAWFCSPCLYGRIDQRHKKHPDTNKENFSTCSSGCWIFCGASCFHLGWLVTLLKRGEVRDRFGIKGNACTDCLVAYFCNPCALAQMNTELKDTVAREQGRNGLTKDGYVPPGPPAGAMSYQQPLPQEKGTIQPDHQQPLYQPQGQQPPHFSGPPQQPHQGY